MDEHHILRKGLIIIPALNEAEKLPSILSLLPKRVMDIDLDLLVVDDGSTDATAAIAQSHGAVIIHHDKPTGYGRAVLDGFAYAVEHKYDFVAKMDGDGQHDVKYLATVVKILRRGDTDYVISSRYLREVDRTSVPPLDRRVVNAMMTGVVNQITKFNLTEVFCGFFGLTTELIRKMELTTETYGLELEMLIKAWALKARVLEVPHPLIYGQNTSHFAEAFDPSDQLTDRLRVYSGIVFNTLQQLQVNQI